MENQSDKLPTGENSWSQKDNGHIAPKIQSINRDAQTNNDKDKTLASDNLESIATKEEKAVARSTSINSDTDHSEEDKNKNSPCANMFVENSKDESDYSDYDENNTRCQLTNQAVRAQLLNSVANPANGSDSKLRVSVFDHRIIPQKFIIPKKGEERTSVSSVKGTERGNKNLRPQDLNCESVQDNKRKLSSLSYTVLKASKRYNRENSSESKSPTSPGMDDSEVRTRFDILLRNLIGDVNDMKVEQSHVTVSSGYESDYAQNQDVDEASGKTVTGITNTEEQNKENFNRQTVTSRPVNYFSESGSATQGNKTMQAFHSFSSLPTLPTQGKESVTGTMKRSETDIPIGKTNKQEKDTQGFNYAQRHNYKLTKVTRSMYEIIHDLQNGDKTSSESRKRSKKGRRSSQDQSSAVDSGNSSARESKQRGRVSSRNSVSDNPNDRLSTKKRPEISSSAFTGSVVRCVRRPLCNDSQSIQRSSESSNRLVTGHDNNNSNKVQNDLRNLLCDTSEVTLLSGSNNGHLQDFNTLSGSNNTHSEFSSTLNGHLDNGFNHLDIPISNDSSATRGQRRPTLNEQFMNRSKPEDHVYETIPGDEKFYEEWKKMQADPKIPKIRRFTTIPDLPGTFIPKEPPALPERKYLSSNESQNQCKDTDNYIFMGDINSNFPGKVNLNTGARPVGSSCNSFNTFTSEASSDGFRLNQPQMYPFPIPDDSSLQVGRHDETSDGYCSIDNLSLLRESFNDVTFPELPSRDIRRVPNTNSLPRMSSQRNDYFLSPVMNREEYKHMQTFSSAISHAPQRQTSRDLDFDLKASVFQEPTKPVFQATYV